MPFTRTLRSGGPGGASDRLCCGVPCRGAGRRRRRFGGAGDAVPAERAGRTERRTLAGRPARSKWAGYSLQRTATGSVVAVLPAARWPGPRAAQRYPISRSVVATTRGHDPPIADHRSSPSRRSRTTSRTGPKSSCGVGARGRATQRAGHRVRIVPQLVVTLHPDAVTLCGLSCDVGRTDVNQTTRVSTQPFGGLMFRRVIIGLCGLFAVAALFVTSATPVGASDGGPDPGGGELGTTTATATPRAPAHYRVTLRQCFSDALRIRILQEEHGRSGTNYFRQVATHQVFRNGAWRHRATS